MFRDKYALTLFKNLLAGELTAAEINSLTYVNVAAFSNFVNGQTPDGMAQLLGVPAAANPLLESAVGALVVDGWLAIAGAKLGQNQPQHVMGTLAIERGWWEIALVQGGGIAEIYLFATPGTKGVGAATLSDARLATGATGNSVLAVYFGGHAGGTRTTLVECLRYANLSLPGGAGIALANAISDMSTMPNNTQVIVVGGALTGSTYTTAAELYLFASMTSKGTAPTALSTARGNIAGASNATVGFTFGGTTTALAGVGVTTVEQYAHALGSTTKGADAAAMSSGRGDMGAAANRTQVLIFGGNTNLSGGVGYVSTVEQYLFATPSTKGAVPAVLSAVRAEMGACGSIRANTAMMFGGLAGPVATTELYQFANVATKGAAPAALSTARTESEAASNRFL